MQLGTTFSTHHLNWLKINPLEATKEYKKLGLKWIRLGACWSEIEKTKGKYDFSDLDLILDFCEKEKIKVILTVGMKAPRYPEYYVPDWLGDNLNLRRLAKITTKNKTLLNETLKFITAVVEHTKDSSAIRSWQVENEPLEPAGPSWLRIDEKFLQEEVNLFRRLDPSRKILVNLWGNELGKRKLYKKIQNFADIVGLDLYLKHDFSIAGKFVKYLGPLDSEKALLKISDDIKTRNELWITELQAEPWEPGGDQLSKDDPPSFMPEDFEKNVRFALKLKPKLILLWGFEYWLYRKLKRNDDRYWNEAKRVIKKYS